jgi:endonuclease III
VNRTALRRKAHHVVEILAAQYGSPRHENKDDPLDELVFIILSQMTTHHSFNRVYDRLKVAAPTWDDVATMPTRRFRALIKDAGLSALKAPRVKAILRRLVRDFGGATLAPLRAMNDREAERYLTELPGVGTKTAKCVLMYSLGRPVLPLDTHGWRLARRLGLVETSVPYEKVHDAIEAVVAPEDRYAFHVNAITHGRALCLPRAPRCKGCPVRRLCAAGRRTQRPPRERSVADRS